MMINVLICFIGIVLLAVGIGLIVYCKNALPLLIALGGFMVMYLGAAFTFVPSGYVGVQTAYGQISDKPVKTGANWHIPFIEQIHNINCKQQEINFGDLQIWSETSERTEVYCQNVVVDYQINSEYAAWIWINVEEWDTNLVKQTSIESGIKAATKLFDDTDVTDRAKIESAAKEAVQKSLNEKYGNQIVNVVSVTIGNINFSDAYNAAIEKKAQAKLATETAEYENKQTTQKIEAEAEQKKIQAQAAAEAKKIEAEGKADAIKIQADAEAEANKKIADSLTPELIEKEKIDKWDGKLPTIQGGSGTIVDASTLFDTPKE